MKEFIHLHNHTEYSLLDGAARIVKLVNKAKEEGARAVAITDHGNMYGAIKFYKACEKAKIKPIIGFEAYITNDRFDRTNSRSSDENGGEEDFINPKFHLVLLAKDYQGYLNLAKLSSIAFVEGFYGAPRIDFEILEKYSAGIICLSGCIAGGVSRNLLRRSYADGVAYAQKLVNIFGKDDFYIELQDHGIPEEKKVNPMLVRLADELGLKCVATNDLHYINKRDWEMHDVLLCIQMGRDYDDEKRMRFPSPNFYYKNYDEMSEVLGWKPDALDNTIEIADKCNLVIPFKNYLIPVYKPKNGMDDKEYLRYMAFEGLEQRYGVITDEIRARAEMELNVIITMGFASYYLIVWDFIHYAREHGIPVGYGRGSGVGSIIAYAIRITNVDPLKYDLIFERFLNSSRKTMPDFDIDFCGERREEVIEYVKGFYGENNVAQIITFGTMKKKLAIKDVARVFKVPFAEVNKLLKNIIDDDPKNKATIADLINPASDKCVRELYDMYSSSDTYKKVLDFAVELENMPRNRSKHAAGVIICSIPVSDRVPLSRNGEDITTQYDMTECEEIGLLKMDFLGLKTLTDIQSSIDFVKANNGVTLNFDELGIEDQEVYDLIGRGETDTVFQLESEGMKRFMRQLKPTILEEIIAGVSLYRPGPMKFCDSYVENKKHRESIVYSHPRLEPILKTTYGIIVYQEQAMQITRALAGYSMNEADNFRKFISKKKTEDIPKEKAKFVNGCINNGVDETFAYKMWADLEAFGSYAFNKSHAAAYSVLTYQTAFLKRYYPAEYISAVINNRLNNPKDTSKYLKLLNDMNIKLLPPDINTSYALFTPIGKDVSYGLACIKNVGKNSIEEVVRERESNGRFKDFSDFARRIVGSSINKRMIENLIKGGAFDSFGYNRATMLKNYEKIIEIESGNKNLLDGGQLFLDIMLEDDFKYEIAQESTRDKLIMEKEVLGRYVTGHPLAGHEKDFEKFDFNTNMFVPIEKEPVEDEEEEKEDEYPISNGTIVRAGGLITEITVKLSAKTGKQWAFAQLEDLYDSCEIVFYGNNYNRCKQYLINDSLVKIKAKVIIQPSMKPKLEIMELIPWDLPEQQVEDVRTLYIRLEENDVDTFYKVQEAMHEYPGVNKIRVQIGTKVYIFEDITVGNLDALKDRLIGIVGYRNVKLITT